MRYVRFVIILLLIALHGLADQGQALKLGEPVPSFVLKDADDNEYSLDKLIKDENKKVVILIIGDRTTRESGNKWGIELHKIYGNQKDITILMIADLRGLPFFATEAVVKWGVKREKLPIKILLDWDGKVSQSYKTKRGESNIFVINKDKKLVHVCQGVFTEEKSKALKEKVDSMIKK